jgi:hypothetical protein
MTEDILHFITKEYTKIMQSSTTIFVTKTVNFCFIKLLRVLTRWVLIRLAKCVKQG